MFSMNNETRFRLKDIRSYGNVLRFLLLLWREQRWIASILAVTTFIMGIIPAVELWVIGRLIDHISVWFGTEEGNLFPVYFTTALLIVLMLFRNWTRLISEGLQDYLRDRMAGGLQQEVLAKAYRVDMAFYEQEESYNRLQRANEGLHTRLVNVYQSALLICEGVITSVGYTIALMNGHWLLGPLVLIAVIPSLWLRITRARQNYIFDYDSLTPTRRRLAYFKRLLSDRHFAKEVRLFGLGQHFLSQWQFYQHQWKKEVLWDVKREIKYGMINDVVLNIVLSGAALFLAFLIVGGQLSLGLYVMMIQSVIRLQEKIEFSMMHLRMLYQDGLFAHNLFHFLDQDDLYEHSGTHPFPAPIREGIVFENVWFHYPNREEWVVKDVSFHIRPGETISLVGRNGAGKTTIVKLLLGLYHPSRGRILIDGISIDEIREGALRQHISAIFQDFTRFELTLKESIGLGNVDQLENVGRIQQAAAQSGVDQIAEQLESGYDTMLNKEFDGAELSGGQWQKVALARSMMRDAQVWVLDEPTASLDPRAEVAVFEEYKELSEGRTTFLISHRIGTARLADRILVIRDGQVVETGNHEQLVQNRGEYAALFQLQAQWYTESDQGV